MRDLFQQSRFRLAACASCFFGVWAEEDRVDAPAERRERSMHLVVDCIERRNFEEPASDAGLVRCQHDVIAGLSEPCDGFETAGYRPPLLRRLDVARAVLVDDAVPVEYDELHRTAGCGGSRKSCACQRVVIGLTQVMPRASKY